MKNLLNEENYSEYINATEKGTDTLIKQHRLTSDFFKQYSIDADYSYVNLKYIHDENEIPQLIKNNSKEKWLIFVDTVATGNRIEKNIISHNNGLKNNVVFINSKYEYDESASESFEELSEENLISKKVVIATAELDNGVSFVDESLRNIVILCDNEEEFIQMLGRKRKDSHSINLYITKRDIAYFKRRRKEIRKTLDYYSNYEYKIINSSQLNIYRQKILDEILHNNFALHHFKKFVCVFNGNLNINYISINRLYSLQNFYNQIIDELESDSIAFLKRQAGWIGVDSDKLNEIIQEANMQYKESLKKELKNHVDQSLDDDSREKFIDDIKPLLLALVTEENGFDSDYIKTVKDYLTKSDRVLTLKHFNTIMSHPNIDLNYQMIKENDNYTIKTTNNK